MTDYLHAKDYLNTPVADIPTDNLWHLGNIYYEITKYDQGDYYDDDGNYSEELELLYSNIGEDFFTVQDELVKRGEIAPEDARDLV
jgi:hypothetical protein